MAREAKPRTKAPWERKTQLYATGEHLRHIKNDPQLHKIVSTTSSVRLSDSGERNREKALNIWRRNKEIYDAWSKCYRTELEMCVIKFPSTKKLLGPCIRLLDKRYKKYVKKCDSTLSQPIKTDVQAKRLLNGAKWRRFRLLKKELRVAIFYSKHRADEMGLQPLATSIKTDGTDDEADGKEHPDPVIEQALKKALCLIQVEHCKSDTGRELAEKVVERLRTLLPPQEQSDKTKTKNPMLDTCSHKPNCASSKDIELRFLESESGNMESEHGVSKHDIATQQQRQKPRKTQRQQPEFAQEQSELTEIRSQPGPTQTAVKPAQPQEGPLHAHSESVHQQPELMHSHSILFRPHPLKSRSKPAQSSSPKSILRDTTNTHPKSTGQRSNFHTRIADQLVSYDTLKKRTVEMISDDAAIGEFGEGSRYNTTDTHKPGLGESSKSGGGQNIANAQKPILEGNSSKSREKQVQMESHKPQMENSTRSMERTSPESQSVDVDNTKIKPKATFHSDNRQYVLDIKEEFRQYALMDGPAREKAANEARVKAFADKEAGRREEGLIQNAPDPPEPPQKGVIAKVLDKLPHIRIG